MAGFTERSLVAAEYSGFDGRSVTDPLRSGERPATFEVGQHSFLGLFRLPLDGRRLARFSVFVVDCYSR